MEITSMRQKLRGKYFIVTVFSLVTLSTFAYNKLLTYIVGGIAVPRHQTSSGALPVQWYTYIHTNRDVVTAHTNN